MVYQNSDLRTSNEATDADETAHWRARAEQAEAALLTLQAELETARELLGTAYFVCAFLALQDKPELMAALKDMPNTDESRRHMIQIGQDVVAKSTARAKEMRYGS